MIIFDLDGTLADCEHRWHLVNLNKNEDVNYDSSMNNYTGGWKKNGKVWQPDWPAFFEACDKDDEIPFVVSIFHDMHQCEKNVQIWSGRSDSVRQKTIKWLIEKMNIHFCSNFCLINDLKMRPVGCYTPDHELKERWLVEYLRTMYPPLEPINKENNGKIYKRKEMIEFVFDSDPKSIEMWRKRGIFVFDCKQTGKEFLYG